MNFDSSLIFTCGLVLSAFEQPGCDIHVYKQYLFTAT